MKKIGLIFDQNTKKVFLLPEDVKKLVEKGIKVFVATNYGVTNKLSDDDYKKAGAQITDVINVVNSSDIVLKVNAFTKNELKAFKNKVAVTLANFSVNVDMLYELLKNKIKSYQWIGLVLNEKYAFFQEFETIKGHYAANKINELAPKLLNDFNTQKKLAKQEAKLAKMNIKLNKFQGNKNNVLILNASFAADEIIRECLAKGMNITLLDNDKAYCESLKNSFEVKLLTSEFGGTLTTNDAHFLTLESEFKTHNVFVNTAIDPVSKNPLRITKEMIESMPCGSLAIDLACENGYAFMFQKQLLKDGECLQSFNKITKTSYLCVKNITDLFPNEVSKIISNKSVEPLIKMANDKTDDFADIIMTKKGKSLNTYLNQLLKIY